jgi:hypothetical protein
VRRGKAEGPTREARQTGGPRRAFFARWGGRVWVGPTRTEKDLPSPSYFRCLFTSFVMSNMLTVGFPKIGFSLPSALIIRRFFESCRPLRLM